MTVIFIPSPGIAYFQPPIDMDPATTLVEMSYDDYQRLLVNSEINGVGLLTLIAKIQDALGTTETLESLVEVARNAHKAEQELAAILRNREIFARLTAALNNAAQTKGEQKKNDL